MEFWQFAISTFLGLFNAIGIVAMFIALNKMDRRQCAWRNEQLDIQRSVQATHAIMLQIYRFLGLAKAS